MTSTATHGDILATLGTPGAERQDAQLAALIRRLADLRPEIAIGWTPPCSATAPRPPRFLPAPRFLHPLEPHPVTGRWPTRDDFPADRDVVDSIARLRAEAAGGRAPRKPRRYWPVHARTRVPLWRRALRLFTGAR
ncbi:hypothetical protein [Actinorugispora endophytica]|uniref:Uncharacterized protein n=1 Tax=Actinorugispora endophytica TaxID=1605990 RepID=A0A4R6UZE7_9ACTN|nr:hypothetical protein [Actinorugispora endophytica]TDQ52956.1 hypothetical protein EV190_10573 [Actinorugispora endophytica]